VSGDGVSEVRSQVNSPTFCQKKAEMGHQNKIKSKVNYLAFA